MLPKTLETPAVNPAPNSVNPTRRILRNGAFAELPDFLKAFNARSIVLVLGEQSFRKSSYYLRLEQILEPYTVIRSCSVSQNPTQDFIQQEIDALKNETYDLVLAIGGGSVLDVSKILATIPRQDETDLGKYLDGKAVLPKSPAILIAIPTTSGTGSEVTPYASLETTEKAKITVSYPSFYPALALIDPELTYSMPAYVTACTGFDALSQAIESYWAVAATPFSQTHALRAVELILQGFEKAFREPDNSESRYLMSLGSCEAGLAIAQTKTTAVHSVSYPITSYFKVAHGHACALTLAPFVRFNAPVMKEGGRPLLKAFGSSGYDEMALKVERLMEAVRLERSLLKLGIDDAGQSLIVQHGFRPDRVKNNPRPLTAPDLQNILQQVK